VLCLSLTVAGSADAQGLLGKFKEKSKQKAVDRVDAAVQEVVDTAASTTERVVRCAVSDALCIANAKAAGSTVVLDSSGTAPPEQTVATGAAQGGTQEPAAPAGAVDACALLTRDEVVHIAGAPLYGVKPRVHASPFGGLVTSSCTYRTQGHALSVEITLERGRTADELAMYLDNLKKAAAETTGAPLAPVAGYGDQAYWGQVAAGNGMLHVIRGTDVLTIRTSGQGAGAGTLEKTREVMSRVYPRYAALPPYVPASSGVEQ
jgi:hypothetical protein